MLITPATVLYMSTVNNNTFLQHPTAQQNETTLYGVNQPPTPQYTATENVSNEFNTAFIFEPGYVEPNPTRSFIPSTNTVASLKRQLNKLEAENNRLRRENKEKYAELEQATRNMQHQTEDRLRKIKQLFQVGTSSEDRVGRDQQGRGEPMDDNYGLSTSRGGVAATHRTFSDNERLSGNNHFKEWAEMVIIELQVIGIVQSIVEEYGGNRNWPAHIKQRVGAVARSLILHSVDAKIRPHIRGLPSAFKMWNMLCNQYNITSIYENHKIMSEFE